MVSPMTNREWLDTLSDADLAKMMQACVHCIYSKKSVPCMNIEKPKGACVTGTMKWLKRKHTKKDEEDLKSFDNWNQFIKAEGLKP